MGNRQLDLTFDNTPLTLNIDLAPQPFDMELNFATIELFRGDDVTINFNITQNGQPFDLTGSTLLFQGKHALGDVDFTFNKSVTVDNALGGTCHVDLSGSDLSVAQSLTAQLYISANGSTQTIAQFPIDVNLSV